MGTDVLISF